MSLKSSILIQILWDIQQPLCMAAGKKCCWTGCLVSLLVQYLHLCVSQVIQLSMSKSHALGLSEDMKMCGFSSQGVVMLFSVSPSHRSAETGCSLRADEDRMDKSDNSSLWCSTVFCSLVKLIISLASRKDFSARVSSFLPFSTAQQLAYC